MNSPEPTQDAEMFDDDEPELESLIYAMSAVRCTTFVAPAPCALASRD